MSETQLDPRVVRDARPFGGDTEWLWARDGAAAAGGITATVGLAPLVAALTASGSAAAAMLPLLRMQAPNSALE